MALTDATVANTELSTASDKVPFASLAAPVIPVPRDTVEGFHSDSMVPLVLPLIVNGATTLIC